jgi:transcriptional regulator with GAF, ATPase, and Fis domain
LLSALENRSVVRIGTTRKGDSVAAASPTDEDRPLEDKLSAAERKEIVDALLKENGNQTRAAKRLGIVRPAYSGCSSVRAAFNTGALGCPHRR